MKIFIDTSAFAALYNSNDQYHLNAVDIWEYISSEKFALYTSNYIISETITLLRSRVNFHVSVLVGNAMFQSKTLNTIYITEKLQFFAWKMYKKYQDKDLSFVDYTSFCCIKEFNIMKAFAFDRHFKQLGYETL